MLCFILKREKSSNHVEAENYTEQTIIELHPQQSYSILVQTTFINWNYIALVQNFIDIYLSFYLTWTAEMRGVILSPENSKMFASNLLTYFREGKSFKY